MILRNGNLKKKKRMIPSELGSERAKILQEASERNKNVEMSLLTRNKDMFYKGY